MFKLGSFFTGCLLVTALLLASCGDSASERGGTHTALGKKESAPAAKVSGRTFYEADIDEEIDALPDNLHYLREDKKARRKILDAIIRRYVLAQEAADLGMEQNPKIQHDIARARDNIIIRELENWQMRNLPVPDEKQIADWYKKHTEDFTIPEQAHARHILLATEKEALAVRDILKGGADFATLAASRSLDDSNKSRGGDLNWFARGMMVAEMDRVLFTRMVPGEISMPVHSQFGWHIIELLGKRPATIKPLEECREEISEILRRKEWDAWVDKAVEKAGRTITNPDYQ